MNDTFMLLLRILKRSDTSLCRDTDLLLNIIVTYNYGTRKFLHQSCNVFFIIILAIFHLFFFKSFHDWRQSFHTFQNQSEFQTRTFPFLLFQNVGQILEKNNFNEIAKIDKINEIDEIDTIDEID